MILDSTNSLVALSAIADVVTSSLVTPSIFEMSFCVMTISSPRSRSKLSSSQKIAMFATKK